MEDALAQLMARHDDLKKPLRVVFISAGVDEEAQVPKAPLHLLRLHVKLPWSGCSCQILPQWHSNAPQHMRKGFCRAQWLLILQMIGAA